MTPPDPRVESHWDPLRRSLQSFRAGVGNPSYAEIADRITAARQAAGMDVHAARVARTTVYDCLRLGRKRVNLSLVREVADVLGASDEQVEEWIARCHTTGPAAPEPAPSSPPARRRTDVLLLLAGCVVLNIGGRLLVDALHLPVYLDMVGTAVAAIALGPWRGAAVGLTTNVLAATTSGLVSLPFAAVNVAGALVWGYGVRRWGRTLHHFFALNLLVAVVCTMMAAPILTFLYDGSVGSGQDTITRTFLDLGNPLVVAVGLSNLLTSTADKLITGFVALVVIAAPPVMSRSRSPLTFLQPGRETTRRDPVLPSRQ